MQGIALLSAPHRSLPAHINSCGRGCGFKVTRSTSRSWRHRTTPARSRASFGEATLQISSSATLKSEILKASGDRNGLDRSGPEVEAIRKSIDALEAREGSLQQLDLTSTTWRLVYTNSKGNSSGKLGPFIGRVTQVFPGDTPAQYINKVQIGPFEAAVLAEYEYARKDRINVTFLNTTFKLGPFRYCKETTMKGHWTLKYADEELRILTSNQNNVFVLARVS